MARWPPEWDVVDPGIFRIRPPEDVQQGHLFLGAPPNRTSRTAKGCQAPEMQPLQTVLLTWEGQRKFSDAYACFCSKVLEPFLV